MVHYCVSSSAVVQSVSSGKRTTALTGSWRDSGSAPHMTLESHDFGVKCATGSPKVMGSHLPTVGRHKAPERFSGEKHPRVWVCWGGLSARTENTGAEEMVKENAEERRTHEADAPNSRCLNGAAKSLHDANLSRWRRPLVDVMTSQRKRLNVA